MKKIKKIIISIMLISLLISCSKQIENIDNNETYEIKTEKSNILNQTIMNYDVPLESFVVEANLQYNNIEEKEVRLDESFKYATYSNINTGFAKLYTQKGYEHKKGVVCVNAGHGVKGGESYEKTFSHPDFSKKLTSGSNGLVVKSYAITGGMTFNGGRPEAEVNLKVAMKLKDILLTNGYSVLMIREDNDSHLDNIARTVLANNYADCHISLHYDSTTEDKGIFYITASRIKQYLDMEPVKSVYKKSDELGDTIINTLKKYDEKIYGKGRQYQDLTQISYSTIPTVDLELGDKISDISEDRLHELALRLYDGIDEYMKILYEENN